MADQIPAVNSNNPFADPDPIVPKTTTEREMIIESTIAVGDHASLTLSKEHLMILDDDDVLDAPTSNCIQLSARSKSTRSIPYYNILSATLTKSDLTLSYAEPTSKRNPSKSSVAAVTQIYSVNSPHDLVERWVSRLLDRAYGPSQKYKRIKVLVNPFGGVGRAQKAYLKHAAPIFAAAGCEVDVEQTTHRGHAMEIAEHLDITAYDVLCCASGDGVPMEAFNGLANKPNATEALRKIAIVQLPCGSGNAMSWNLNGTADVSLATLAIIKGVRTPLDLASVTSLSTGGKRILSFLSQSIGIIAESDLGTDSLRWMGDLRFTIGFLIRLIGETVYPIDISLKTEIEDKDGIKRHYAREVSRRQKLDLGSHDILDEELETTTGLGLPPLKYGTVSDPLTDTSTGKPLKDSNGQLTSEWSPLEPYLNLGNFYCGNMCYMAADTQFFTASLPNDGLLDLVTIDGDIGRIKALSLMFDVAAGRLLDQEVVKYRKVTGVRVIPRFGWEGAKSLETDPQQPPAKPPGFLARLVARFMGRQKEGYFSIDGEKIPFEPFQIEVHRGLGTVLSKRYGLYEYEAGPAGWEKYRDEVEGSDATSS